MSKKSVHAKRKDSLPEIPGRSYEFTNEKYDRHTVKADPQDLEQLFEEDGKRLMEIRSMSGRLVMAIERLDQQSSE